MINGEKWLKNGLQCELKIIQKIKITTHQVHYSLPIKPSPNLPNDLSNCSLSVLMFCLKELSSVSAEEPKNHFSK